MYVPGISYSSIGLMVRNPKRGYRLTSIYPYPSGGAEKGRYSLHSPSKYTASTYIGHIPAFFLVYLIFSKGIS